MFSTILSPKQFFNLFPLFIPSLLSYFRPSATLVKTIALPFKWVSLSSRRMPLIFSKHCVLLNLPLALSEQCEIQIWPHHSCLLSPSLAPRAYRIKPKHLGIYAVLAPAYFSRLDSGGISPRNFPLCCHRTSRYLQHHTTISYFCVCVLSWTRSSSKTMTVFY